MYAHSLNPTWRSGFVDTFLAALGAIPAAALLVTPKIHLYSGVLAINQNLTQAMLTGAECNFSGYAAQVPAITTVPANVGVNVRGESADCIFGMSSPATVSQSANGYWMDAGATVNWVVAEAFANPIPFSSPGDFLDLAVILGLYLLPIMGP
jgi:hypothetical protein